MLDTLCWASRMQMQLAAHVLQMTGLMHIKVRSHSMSVHATLHEVAEGEHLCSPLSFIQSFTVGQ